MQDLNQKSEVFEAFVEQNLVDSHGVVYSGIHSETGKPWVAADWLPVNEYMPIPGFEPWDILNYENAGMTSGAYLAAQTYRYLVTQDETALRRAHRSFEGLCWIYRLGATREEGYFPKTYAGRISHEISTDQYLYAIKGMMAYRQIASDEHRQAMDHMIPRMVDYWVSRGYRHDYFAIQNMLWPLGRFPSLLLAAEAVSGDPKYRAEARRLHEEHGVHRQPTDTQILPRAEREDPFDPSEQALGHRYLGYCIGESAAMDIMELDECLLHSSEHRDAWLKSMRIAWRESCLALVPGGLSRQWVLYDPRTGRVDSPAPHFRAGGEPLGWSYMRWLCGILTPRSTMVARVGIHVARWLPELAVEETLRSILDGVSLDQMRHNIDPDGCQLRPEHAFLCDLVDVDAIVNWLWAYWMARWQLNWK